MTDYQGQPTPAAPQANQAPTQAPPAAAPSGLPTDIKPPPEEIYIEWTAQSRPHKKRNRQYFSTIAILVVLICTILFFAGQFLPIAAVLTVAFLVYVMEMVPPSMVVNRITTYGIRIEDELYYWEEMGRFWFSERYGQKLLHIEIGRFPGRLSLLIGDLDQDALGQLLSEVLVMGKPQPTFFEQAAERLQRLVPLE